MFEGNKDRDTENKNVLDIPVLARYIRFIPTDFNSYKGLRVEVYGFDAKGIYLLYLVARINTTLSLCYIT